MYMEMFNEHVFFNAAVTMNWLSSNFTWYIIECEEAVQLCIKVFKEQVCEVFKP